jgi:hypothetical protein
MQTERLQEEDIGDNLPESMSVREGLRVQRHRAIGAAEHEFGEFKQDKQGQHHDVQRPQPGEPHHGETQAPCAMVKALTIGVTEHEAGQREEHVDAELQVGEGGNVLECMVNRDVEEHDQQGADAPQRVECLKSTRNQRCLSRHDTPLSKAVLVALPSARAGPAFGREADARENA